MACLGIHWSKLHFCWLDWNCTAVVAFQRYIYWCLIHFTKNSKLTLWKPFETRRSADAQLPVTHASTKSKKLFLWHSSWALAICASQNRARQSATHSRLHQPAMNRLLSHSIKRIDPFFNATICLSEKSQIS